MNTPQETCSSIREAIVSLRERLTEIDNENNKQIKWYKKHYTKEVENMEEANLFDSLYLVFSKDGEHSDDYYIFNNDYDIEEWLETKWGEWELFDYSDPEEYMKENIIVWRLHRNLMIERWNILYKNSKPFIKGWSRKREYIGMSFEPTFSIR